MAKTAEDKMLLDILKRWQKTECASVSIAARIFENTTSPLLRVMMEVLQNDSLFHHRIEQAMIDQLDRGGSWIPTEVDFEKIWDDLQTAKEIEDKFVELAKSSLEGLKGSNEVVRMFLIKFLLEEEKKHKWLLEELIKLRGRD